MADLQYVGGLVIQARDPEHLARWYSERFGLLVGVEYGGVLYGGFRSGEMSFHFGIRRQSGRVRPSDACGVAITFHVDDFAGYVEELRERGLEPIGQVQDDEGSFATYRDPENNEVTIWGT